MSAITGEPANDGAVYGKGGNTATVFVPATVGNVGPGFDVLGLAVEGLGDKITVTIIDGPSKVSAVTGRDADLVPRDAKSNCAVIAAEAMLAKLGLTGKGVDIAIERGLPIAGGLGSSAAASVGGALGVVHASGKTVGTDIVLRAALEGEAKVAGRHLDNIAPVLYGRLCLVREVEPPDVIVLPIRGEWWVTLVSPKIKLATKTARGVLPESVSRTLLVQQMANTCGVLTAFASGDHALMRRSLQDLLAEPKRAHLIPHFHDVKSGALGAGALGCSISGAGPTVFALSDRERTARHAGEAMVSAFADIGAVVHVGRPASRGAHPV